MGKQLTSTIGGVVEGFFSQPLLTWSNNERLTTLKYISKSARQINTYCYCPKNDDYVTRNWDLPYPKRMLNHLRTCITFCRTNRISFVFGINPQSFNFGSLALKISQLQSAGCADFCLLYDDIPPAYDLENIAAGHLSSIGKKITENANRLYQYLNTATGKLWLCPPDYCYRRKTALTEELRIVNPNIAFIWTGSQIFSKTIRASEIKRVKTILGNNKKIIWWSNYPVNDCEQAVGVYNLGGFYPPRPETRPDLDGIIVNPMRECYANLPFYQTFSDYLKDPFTYDREKSWKKALETLVGRNWKDYEFILTNFSQRNATDSCPKYLYPKIANIKTGNQIKKLLFSIQSKFDAINSTKAKTKETTLFTGSIFPLFQDVKSFLSLSSQLLTGNVIDLDSFSKTDRFPTNTVVARYFGEVAEINYCRLSTIPGKYKNIQTVQNLTSKSRQFKKKYPGKNKLWITKKDQAVLLNLINRWIKTERTSLLKFINDEKRSVSEKISLLCKRQNINRFYC